MIKSVFIVYMFIIIGYTMADDNVTSSLDEIKTTCEKASKDFTPIDEKNRSFKSCSKEYSNFVFFDQPANATGCDTFEKYNTSMRSLIDAVITCYGNNNTDFEQGEILALDLMQHIFNDNTTVYMAATSYLSKKENKREIYLVKKECFDDVENNTNDNITQKFMSDTFPLYVSLFFNIQQKTCTKAESYTACIQNSSIDGSLKAAVQDLYNFISKYCPSSSGFSLRSGLGFLLGFLIVTLTY